MKKRFTLMMTTLMMAWTAWAQAPKADILDVVFNDDGSATDVSAMGNTVQSVGPNTVVKSTKYGINEACFKENELGSSAEQYYRIDMSDDFKAALADGHTFEALIRYNLKGQSFKDAVGAAATKFVSATNGGGCGLSTYERTGSLTNDTPGFDFLCYVGGKYRHTVSDIVPEDGVYYHVVGVWDQDAGQVRLYVNGQKVAQNDEATGDFKQNKSGWMGVGANPGSAGGVCSFRGDVAIARVYDDPLSDAQVAALYSEIQAMDTGAEEHTEKDVIQPYLSLKAGNDVELTQTGDFEYQIVTTGSDPYLPMHSLYEDLAADQTVLTCEIKAPQAIPGCEFFYSNSSYSFEAGREMTFGFPAAEDWTPFYIDLATYLSKFGWGYAGDILRMDVGAAAGLTLNIRNIHFITRSEYLDIVGSTMTLEKDADGYYLVKSPDDLKTLATAVNNGAYRDISVRLTNDIDMTGIEDYVPIGVANSDELNHTGQDITNPGFSGIFDGQGHEIQNLTACYNSSYATSGVFGTITGTVKNLGVRGYTFNNGAAYSGRFAALAGQLVEGTIENCYVTASTIIDTGEIVSGLVAGNYGGTVRNCFEYGNDIQTYSRAGHLVGDAADDNNVRIGTEINCYSQGGVTGTYSSNMTDCHSNVSTERFQSGEIAYLLNSNSQDVKNPVFYQTIGEDPCPTMDKTHGYVLNGSEGYTSIDPANYQEAWDNLLGTEQDYLADAVGQADVLGSYEEYLNSITGLSSFSEFLDVYYKVQDMKVSVVASVNAYKVYTDKIQYVKDYLAADQTFSGDARDLLESYLNENVEPGDQFANGSYPYIIENCLLDEDQIVAEATKVQKMLDTAIQGGYGEGADVSSLLVNAQLNDGTNGWDITGSVSVSKLASDESQNVATSSTKGLVMQQSLEGLTPGVYKLELPAAYRANDDDLSLSQNAFVYLNNDKVYVPTTREGHLSGEAEPAHVDNYDPMEDENGEFLGYVPNSTQGYGYAFAAGYYQNTITTQVGEDGKLTVGISMPGCNRSNALWMGQWKLIYCGPASTTTADAAMDEAIACQSSRLNTLITDYVADDYDYEAAPSYDANLKGQISAAIETASAASSAEDKLAAISQLSDLMQQVSDCKQAYVDMMSMSEALLDVFSGLNADGTITADEYQVVEDQINIISDAYLEGSLTLEQAKAQNPFQNLSNMPAIVDNVAQISTPMELIMFSTMVSSGLYRNLDAVLKNDIDMTGIYSYPPIGVANKNQLNHTGQAITNPGYAGTFDGQGHEIKNLVACMNANYATSGVFGTITGTVKNLGVRGYTFDNGGAYEGRFAALAGQLVEGTILNCYVTESIINDGSEIVSGLVAGNYGGLVQNCYEYGNKINAYSRAGHLVGDAADDNGVRTGTEINCYSEGGVTGTYSSNMSGCESNVKAARFEGGEIAYLLNGGTSDGDLTWYQTIHEDNSPVLDKTHLVVRQTESGNYSNFDDTNADLWTLVQEAQTLSNTTKIGDEEPLIQSGDQLSTNCLWTADYPISNMVDGDKSTYFHSRIDTDLSLGTEYFQVDLTRAITAFTMEWYGRSDGAGTGNVWHDTPDKIRIEATNTPGDEESWKEICTNEYPVEDIDGAYYKTDDAIELGDSYKNFRFYILHSTHGMTYWNVTEFQMYNVGDTEGSIYDTEADIRAQVDVLDALIQADLAKAKTGTGTEADLKELISAMNTLKRLLGMTDSTNEELAELSEMANRLATQIQEGILIYDTDQFSDNCQWESQPDLNTSTLLDGDWMTYFHSRIDTPLGNGTEYLQVNLRQAVSSFYVEYWSRNDGASYHDIPYYFRIEATNTPEDESSWTTIRSVLYDIPNAAGTVFKSSDPIDLGAEYTAVRFYVLGSTSGLPYWNISEFQMYAAEGSLYSQNADLREAADRVADLSQDGAMKAEANEGTEEDLTALQQAYDTLQKLFQSYTATGIQQISAEPQINTQTDKIYTINGIRVEKTHKGLYIINGKKVLVK